MAIPLRELEINETASLEWEEVDCPLCGSNHWVPWMEATDSHAPIESALRFMLARCQACGLTFTNPRPTSECQVQFHLEDDPPVEPLLPARFKRFIAPWLKSDPACKLLPVRGQRKLLCVGFGHCSSMKRWDAMGWRAFGLDLREDPLPRGKFDLGLPMFKGGFASSRIPPDEFDAVTMWQALEQVHEPMDLLQAAHQVLLPGGRLLVRTPNLDSWQFRQFGSAWHGLNVPRNLTHFTPTSLRLMLTKVGFRVQKVQMVRQRRWLQASAKRAEALVAGRSGFLRWLQHPTAASVANWFAYLTRQADCMIALASKE